MNVVEGMSSRLTREGHGAEPHGLPTGNVYAADLGPVPLLSSFESGAGFKFDWDNRRSFGS